VRWRARSAPVCLAEHITLCEANEAGTGPRTATASLVGHWLNAASVGQSRPAARGAEGTRDIPAVEEGTV